MTKSTQQTFLPDFFFHIPRYSCVVCNEEVTETQQRLFWDCTFAQTYQNYILPNKEIGILFYNEVNMARDHL
jgi:hypothetical protein